MRAILYKTCSACSRTVLSVPFLTGFLGELRGGAAGGGIFGSVDDLETSVDRMATETGFSGVVRVDRGDTVAFVKAYGLAHRGCGAVNTVDHEFGIASGTKGLTALAVVSLIEEGRLQFNTTARSLLKSDLPLIGDDVTSNNCSPSIGHR